MARFGHRNQPALVPITSIRYFHVSVTKITVIVTLGVKTFSLVHDTRECPSICHSGEGTASSYTHCDRNIRQGCSHQDRTGQEAKTDQPESETRGNPQKTAQRHLLPPTSSHLLKVLQPSKVVSATSYGCKQSAQHRFVCG